MTKIITTTVRSLYYGSELNFDAGDLNTLVSSIIPQLNGQIMPSNNPSSNSANRRDPKASEINPTNGEEIILPLYEHIATVAIHAMLTLHRLE